MSDFFLLLILFQIKHFLADYPLQNEYMLGKFKGGLDWVNPLSLHAGVHGFFTFVICLFFLRNSEYGLLNTIILAWFDFISHFWIDRIKASPSLLGRFKALSAFEWQALKTHPTFTNQDRLKAKRSNKYFWWSLGLDQMAHHLTHYLIIYLALRSV